MQRSTLIVCLLAVVASPMVSAVYNKCTEGDACIDIRQCDRFSPHHNEPGKWSTRLRHEFARRVCERESSTGINAYKVCCRNARITTLMKAKKTRLELLDVETCGVRLNERVALGEDAKLFEYPWMALLSSRGQWICGGTLINKRYVLTAAHCVRNEVLDFVRLGEFDLSQTIDCDPWNEECAPPPQDITVKRVIVHGYYSPRRKQNDIALLRLSRPVSVNTNVNPICLPVTPELRRQLPTEYYVTGWGSTENEQFSNKLQFARMKVIPNSECSELMATVDRYLRITDTQVCTIGVQKWSEHCNGDSGGPLQTLSTTKRYVLHGVVSFGLKFCGKQSVPGVYTNVHSFVEWILDNLAA